MAIKVSGTEVISDDKRILNNEDLPDIRPSLLLDFANSKTLDPRITFTRGSTATYWDGKTTAKAEENLFKYSQELDNGYWNGLRAVKTANATTAPDGTTTADAINQASGETSGGFINPDGTEGYTSGVTYTASIYAKPNGKNFLRVMTTYANGTQTTWFNLSTGSVGTSSSDHTSSIVDAGNGWYRCIVTATADSDGYVNFYISEADGASTVTDDQTGYYAWGAQLEQRSSATAYTATTSSPIVKYQPVLQTAASGEARFDHDPVTGESKGLLIEEARTNLLTQSVIDTSSWSVVRSSITENSAAAPDGTLTASTLVEDTTASNTHIVRQDFSFTSDQAYTASVWVKPANRNYVRLQINSAFDGGNSNANFNLLDGSVVSSGTGCTARIESHGNGWYRCSIASTATATDVTPFTIMPEISEGDPTYDGDGYSGLFLWGAQVEEGSFPTSYIPTSGSTVTRAKDDASITGDNFSGFFSNQVGTIYAEYGQVHEGDSVIGERLVTVYPSSDNTVKYNLEGYRAEVRYKTTWDGVNFNNETRSGGKVAMAFDDTGFSAASLGVIQGNVTRQPYSQQSGRMFIGSANGGSHTNACIPKIAYYPKRLPNATLQAMTEA